MNLMELFIPVTLRDKGVKEGIDKLKSGVSTFGKVGAAAFAGAATGLLAIGKASVNAYGNFEQLAGGAKKIFDEMDYSKIERDANNAYKELNMSASQYIETMNLAGATFAQTMGDEAGYDTARKGIKAIADFASGTGKSIDLLNEKYQLITRSASGYQSIADQFAGILPQTSADFLEQAQAAGFLSDSYTKLTEVPVAEYQQAVTAMLEKGVADLGLANNTANESMGTLTGSLAMVRAAWENLVVGFADPDADLGQLIDNMVESATAALSNIQPVAERAMEGIATFIGQAAPILAAQLPALMDGILPPLLDGAAQLVASIVENLPALVGTVWDAAWDAIDTLGNNLADKFPEFSGAFENLEVIVTGVTAAFVAFKAAVAIQTLIAALVPAITALTAATEGQTIAQAALNLVMKANPIALIITAVVGLVAAVITLWKTNEDFRNAVIEIWESIKGVFVGAWESIKEAWDAVKPYFTSLWEDIKNTFAVAKEVLAGFFSAAWDAIKAVWSVVAGYFQNVWNTVAGIFSVVQAVLAGDFQGAWDAIKDVFAGWNDFFSGLKNGLVDIFWTAVGAMADIGKAVVDGFLGGIKNAWNNLTGWVGNAISGLKAKFTSRDGFDEHSPSKWGAKVFENLVEGGISGWNSSFPALENNVAQSIQSLRGGFDFGASFATAPANTQAQMWQSGQQANNQPIIIENNVNLDGKVISRQTYQYNQDEQTRRGASLINP